VRRRCVVIAALVASGALPGVSEAASVDRSYGARGIAVGVEQLASGPSSGRLQLTRGNLLVRWTGHARDMTFGDGGRVPVAAGRYVVRTDGSFHVFDSSSVRTYDRDGHALRTWADGGTWQPVGTDDRIGTAVLDPLGRLVVAVEHRVIIRPGTFVEYEVPPSVSIVRLTTDGRLDPTWAGDGVATLERTAGASRPIVAFDDEVLVSAAATRDGCVRPFCFWPRITGRIDASGTVVRQPASHAVPDGLRRVRRLADGSAIAVGDAVMESEKGRGTDAWVALISEHGAVRTAWLTTQLDWLYFEERGVASDVVRRRDGSFVVAGSIDGVPFVAALDSRLRILPIARGTWPLRPGAFRVVDRRLGNFDTSAPTIVRATDTVVILRFVGGTTAAPAATVRIRL
jgi:hypothetical protein